MLVELLIRYFGNKSELTRYGNICGTYKSIRSTNRNYRLLQKWRLNLSDAEEIVVELNQI